LINKNIQCFLPRQKVIKSRIDSTPLPKYQTETLPIPGVSAFSHRKGVIPNRYSKQKSTIITSNRPIEDWGLLLKDNAASSAILDFLLHQGHLLKFERKSYRLKEAAKRLSQKKNKD